MINFKSFLGQTTKSGVSIHINDVEGVVTIVCDDGYGSDIVGVDLSIENARDMANWILKQVNMIKCLEHMGKVENAKDS